MTGKSTPKRKKLRKKGGKKNLLIHSTNQSHKTTTTDTIITYKQPQNKREIYPSKYHQTHINCPKHPRTDNHLVKNTFQTKNKIKRILLNTVTQKKLAQLLQISTNIKGNN